MYELDFFGHMIREEFLEQEAPLQDPDDQYFEHSYFINDHKEFFLTALEEAMAMKTPQELKQFVQGHQRTLVRYVNELLDIMRQETYEAMRDGIDELPTRLNLCRLIFRTVEGLLLHMEREFSGEFNMDFQIPNAFRLMTIKNHQQELVAVLDGLSGKGVPEDLLEAAEKPFTSFTSSSDPMENTWKKMRYLDHLLGELKKIGSGTGSRKPAPEQLFETLYWVNHNSHEFYEHIHGKCQAELDSAPTLAGKQEALVNMQAYYDGLRLRPYSALWPHQDNIRTMTAHWLGVEETRLNKLMAMRPEAVAGASPADNIPEDPRDFKLPFNLSGSELAFLVKVFFEHKAIADTKKVNIYRFCARRFLVDGNKDINEDTFDTRFNNPSVATKNAIKELLMKISKTI